MFILIPFIARVLLESFILVSFNLKGNLKGSETKPYLRERILEGAYFNKGVCHVNHNSIQYMYSYFSVHNHATSSHSSSY